MCCPFPDSLTAASEEREVLPMLSANVPLSELLRLGEEFEAAEDVVASRPHPFAPETGVAAIAAHILTKPIDDLRDRWSGRKKEIEEELKHH